MNSRARNLLGALLLCALSICAFAAANASAAGLTAVECVEHAEGKYNTSQCLTPATPGNFETRPIFGKQAIEGKSTRATETGHELGSTANPVSILHTTINGVETTITCGTGTVTGGSIENAENAETHEIKIHITGAVDTWTECHASPKAKPTKICTVEGIAPKTSVGTIATNALTATSGAEHKVVIKPETAESFTKFKIKASGGECFTVITLELLVTGEAWGRANTETHSHLTLDEASNAGSPLRINGASASQTETISGFTKGTSTQVGAETF